MLDRLSNTIPSVAAAEAVADSDEINYSGYAGGMVFVPTGATTVLLTWYAAEKPGGTYLAAYDEYVTVVTQVVSAAKAYAIPSALFGCRAIKVTGNAATTLKVSLKG